MEDDFGAIEALEALAAAANAAAVAPTDEDLVMLSDRLVELFSVDLEVKLKVGSAGAGSLTLSRYDEGTQPSLSPIST